MLYVNSTDCTLVWYNKLWRTLTSPNAEYVWNKISLVWYIIVSMWTLLQFGISMNNFCILLVYRTSPKDCSLCSQTSIEVSHVKGHKNDCSLRHTNCLDYTGKVRWMVGFALLWQAANVKSVDGRGKKWQSALVSKLFCQHNGTELLRTLLEYPRDLYVRS